MREFWNENIVENKINNALTYRNKLFRQLNDNKFALHRFFTIFEMIFIFFD